MKTTNIIAKVATSTLLFCIAVTALAQQETPSDWEFEVKAGVNIGGASPLSMPREIRKIDSYSPRLNASIEGVATKWLGTDHRWGVSAGLKFEQKGMITGATTSGKCAPDCSLRSAWTANLTDKSATVICGKALQWAKNLSMKAARQLLTTFHRTSITFIGAYK